MGGSSTTVQKSETDPEIKSRQLGIFDRGLAIANTPFQAYTGQRVADFSPTQLQVKQLLQNIVESRTGDALLNQAGGAFGELSGYTAPRIAAGNYAASTIAAPRTLSAPTLNAPGQLSAPRVQPAGTLKADQLTSPGTLNNQAINAQKISSGMLRDTDLKPYLNPYAGNVIDAALSDLARAHDIQRVADSQAATAAKAFGGSRHAVADALSNEAYLRTVASTDANLRQQGLQNAQQAALADIANRFNADALNANLGLQADTSNASNRQNADAFNLNTLHNLAGQNATNKLNADRYNLDQGYDAAKTNAQYTFDTGKFNLDLLTRLGLFNTQNRIDTDRLNLANATDTDKFNAGVSNDAARFNLGNDLAAQTANAGNNLSAASLRGQAGINLANLSDQQMRQYITRAGLLAAQGQAEQANDQARLDAQYEEFMRMVNDPLIKQQLAASGVAALPHDGTMTTRETKSPGLLDIFSTLASGFASAGTGYKGFR